MENEEVEHLCPQFLFAYLLYLVKQKTFMSVAHLHS